MWFKMECHSKFNVTQYGMIFKMECHSKCNITQNGMSLKWNITLNGTALNIECHW